MPNRLADERDALTQQLDFHRATLLRKLDGLDGEPLRRPMTASGLSLLGLVKHLAETEHGWFLRSTEGCPSRICSRPTVTQMRSFASVPMRRPTPWSGSTCGPASGPGPSWPPAELDDVVTTPWGAEVNLRAILVHMVQETARHNGHADIIREAIDGTTGD